MCKIVNFSGLSLLLLHKNLDPNVVFYLPCKKTADLDKLLKEGIIGGLSMVWNRLAVAGETRIRNGPNVVKKVMGLGQCTFWFCI